MKSERTMQLEACKIDALRTKGTFRWPENVISGKNIFHAHINVRSRSINTQIWLPKIVCGVRILTIYTYRYVPYYTSIFEPYYHHYYYFFHTDGNHPRLPSALNYFRILWELRSWVCSHDFFNNSLPIQFFLFILCCSIAYTHAYTHAFNAPPHPYKWCRSKMSRNLVRRGAAN